MMTGNVLVWQELQIKLNELAQDLMDVPPEERMEKQQTPDWTNSVSRFLFCEAHRERAAKGAAVGALADKLEAAGLKEEAAKLHEFQAVVENSESTGKDLQDAAHGAHELAEQLRADGHLELADEMEKLALQLDGAAEKKLSVEALEAEKAAKDGLKDVAAGAHALADKLREDGHGELADMVEKIAKEVDHALEGELDVEEVERVIGDAKAAADKLRAAGLTEEAALMDEMVATLEEALHAHHEAEDKKKEAELAAAAGEAAGEAAALAAAAGALADKLEAAGLTEEAAKLHEFQAVLESSESTGKDLQDAAHGAHELAEKLRADGHLELADEMEKLALQLDGAADKKLNVEALELRGQPVSNLVAKLRVVAEDLTSHHHVEVATTLSDLLDLIENSSERDDNADSDYMTSVANSAHNVAAQLDSLSRKHDAQQVVLCVFALEKLRLCCVFEGCLVARSFQ